MMPKRAFLWLMFFLVFAHPQYIYAADTGACAKPKVAVKLQELTEETYKEVLTRQYPFQTKEYWLQHIQNKMIEKLRANSPGIAIFPMDSGEGYDYYIDYSVAVIGCGEEEKIGDLLSSKDVCYWVIGMLYSNDACGIAGVGFRSANMQHKEIDTSVTLFALQMGNLETITAEHERKRPIPPRGPRIRIEEEPKAVSPLEDERETVVDARITNCKGEPVYDKVGERFAVVAGPKQGKRGETHPIQENASREAAAWREVANAWLISPNSQGGAALKYKLTKGIKAGTETLSFIACGLGTKAEKKQVIEIDGLEIRVKPRKSQLKPGEETQIDIDFLKVSAKGDRKPIPGRDIQLKIDGLKDGVITPKDKVSTNVEGRATLVYQAGQNDRSVRVTAFYQPQKYPDRAEGSGVVLVQEGKGDLEVQINGSLNWTGEDKDTRGTITTNFTINGTMSLDKQKHGGVYENYEIKNLQLSYSHHAQFHRKKTTKNCLETLSLEVRGEGSSPVQKGRIVIRYPRDTAGSSSHKQGELDIRLSSGPIPAKWKNCPERCKCQTSDKDIDISIGVVDQKSPIARNQQEFCGSRSFGITDLHGAMNLAVAESLAFQFNDNESRSSSLPLPKELEQIIAQRGGSVEQMRKLGVGIKEGNDGRLTWKIRKLKSRD